MGFDGQSILHDLKGGRLISVRFGKDGTTDVFPPGDSEVWRDLRIIPLYVCCASSFILLFTRIAYTQTVKSWLSKYVSYSSNKDDEHVEASGATSLKAKVKAHISSRGGAVIYAFQVTRLFGCSLLIALSLKAAILDPAYGAWTEVTLAISYAYATFLSFFPLASGPTFRGVCDTHAIVVLFVLLCVFGWRNIIPLGKVGGIPADAQTPWLLWARGVLITIVGAVIPLFIPRIYRPFDPANPSAVPNPEQTASVMSFAFYAFTDSIVFAAYRLPHLPYDSLPPLSDFDQAKNLARNLYKLEPLSRQEKGLKPQYLFWGLMDVFGWDYSCMAVLQVLMVFTEFLQPFGINRLLNYLGTEGHGATVQVWVWILLLLLSPVVGSIVYNLYIFVTQRMVVHAQSVLIQLIFQHSLKIRLTEETSSTSRSVPSTVVSTDAATPAPEAHESGSEAPRSHTNGSDSVIETESSGSESATLPDKGGSKAHSDHVKDDKSSAEPKSSHIVGKINNLVGTDMQNLLGAKHFLSLFIEVPLHVVINVWFLYAILGWAAIVGMAIMILGFPIPGRMAQLMHRVQVEQMKKTDARIQAITETMSIMRMIKLFGWEAMVKQQMREKRDQELLWIKRRQIFSILNRIITFILPLITMVAAYSIYSLVMKQELTASIVFSSMVLFNSLGRKIRTGFWELPALIQAKVSLDRIDDFLNKTELLNRFKPSKQQGGLEIDAIATTEDVIGFHDATFYWMDTSKETPHGGQRNFRLHIDDLIFEPNTINLIVGPTGSGKTSILMALLGEMHFVASGPGSWFNLPRSHGVSYAAQESWIQNETIKENILFGEPYDVDRYKKVIHQCALERDISLFDAGDNAEVGEKGLTLSGGQKARLTLARAIYSRSRVILLDDVLASLDVHTARWVVDNCFRGDLIKGRTVVLITHNVALAAPVAGKIISLGNNGCIASQGSVSQTLSFDLLLRAEIKESVEAVKVAEEVKVLEEPEKDVKADGKLILAEEMAQGRLSWSALQFYIKAFGGPFFWFLIIASFLANHVQRVLATWWLGVWASAYEHSGQGSAVNVTYYIAVYAAIIALCIGIYAINGLTYTYASVRASRKLHNQLRNSVLGSTLRWLDQTPIGRVISRFTQDIREIDGPLPESLQDVINVNLSLVTTLGAIVIISPIFLLPGAVLAVLGAWLGQVYLTAQMSIKRETSNKQSPLYSHFGAATAGLISIRAYGAQASFQDEMCYRIDQYARSARTQYNLNRWISLRIDVLGALFTAGLAVYLVYVRRAIGASNTGFSLTMAVEFSDMILWWVRAFNFFEVSANSLERIIAYIKIDQEPTPTNEGQPPAYWPASGSIRAENLSAKYSADGPVVLDNLNFEIKSGERVGIVGRTGSGKSSLTLSLLRMILTTGVVYFDGRPTHEINLDALRANLTIIPQDPILISGTLRTNLDPFLQHDDAALHDALRAAGLFRLQGDEDKDQITLDSAVASSGGNFSVGQRQIIAMARAIVRNAKVLILDEATASVDAETDIAIQASIRRELKHATLITIAHRLQTVADYDKIMVLDAGRLVEFDTPIALLEKEEGSFRALVDQSVDKETLWELARNGRATSS